MLYELCYKADIEWVVFTCGSSSGRGPRCAAWFLDWVRNVAGDDDMGVMVLEGGVKGWVKAGSQYTQFVDGYREGYWKELLAEEEKSKAENDGTAADGSAANGTAGNGISLGEAGEQATSADAAQ